MMRNQPESLLLECEFSRFNIIDRGCGVVEISNGRQKHFVAESEVKQFADQLFVIDDLFRTSGPASDDRMTGSEPMLSIFRGDEADHQPCRVRH